MGRKPLTADPPSTAGDLPKLAYTVDELCQACGISRAKIYEEIKAQRLRVKKIGARTIIPIDEAKAWLKI